MKKKIPKEANIPDQENYKLEKSSSNESVSNDEDDEEEKYQVNNQNPNQLFGSVWNGLIEVKFSPITAKKIKALNQTEEAPAVIVPHKFKSKLWFYQFLLNLAP